MLAIDKVLVSEDIIEKKFVCDLLSCKGECCVAGTSGAPLEKEELPILKRIYTKVKPYMNPQGIAEIEKQGLYLTDSDGDYVTPLIDGDKHCAFVYFDKYKIAKCAIEKAHYEGKITFKKPISCHLYPIRIEKTNYYENLNYERWSVCSPACSNGENLNVPIYRFLKDPLIRKYGKRWYSKLEKAATLLIKPKI